MSGTERADDSPASRSILGRVRRVLGSSGEAVDGLLERRPGLYRGLVRYGFLLFALVAAVFIVLGAASPPERGQQLVYATADGGISSLLPASGAGTEIYTPRDGGFAAAPLLNGGSRSLSFTVFEGEGRGLRGDLYGADLVRGTRAMIQSSKRGEAFVYGGYSSDRRWLMASRFASREPPNVAVLASSGATLRYPEPSGEGAPPILGPSWTAQNSLYAWRRGRGSLTLTAYNFFEERQAVVYRTKERVGQTSYNFRSNTAVFDERPKGKGLEDSRLVALAGTGEVPVKGTGGLGVYDPSAPVPELDYGMAVIWTDGEESGVGLFDPATWTFHKTGVRVESGDRYPQISYDGSYVATMDASGGTVAVRRMDDGSVVRRVEGVQSPEAALQRMRDAGLEVPREAAWFAPAPFAWRSFEGS